MGSLDRAVGEGSGNEEEADRLEQGRRDFLFRIGSGERDTGAGIENECTLC